MTIYELMGERSMEDLVTQLAEGGFLCPAFNLRPHCRKQGCKECWTVALSKVEEVKLKCAK